MKTNHKTQSPLSRSQMDKQPPMTAYTSSLLTKSQQIAKPEKIIRPRALSPKNQINEEIQNNRTDVSPKVLENYKKLDNNQFNELLQEVSNKASSKVKVKADAKVDLSNRLPIVVFLQSIEIERLLSEVESWKFKYLDLDRRISSRIGLEEQIRKEQDEKVQIQVACQQKIQLWAEEIKKQKALNEKAQMEYQQLTRRFELSQEEWKQKMKQQEVEFNKQLKESLQELQKRVDMAEKKANILLREMEDLKQAQIMQLNQLNNEFEFQKQSIHSAYKNQIDQLNGEIVRLNGLLDQANQEIAENARKLNEFNQIKKQLQNAQNEIEELNEKLQKLAEILQITSDENRSLKKSNEEISYQLKVLNQKCIELQNLVNNLRNDNQKKDREIDELENENQSLKTINEELKQKLSELMRYPELIRDYEKRMEMLIQENNALLFYSKNELQMLIARLKALEGFQDKTNSYKSRVEELERLLKERENSIDDLSSELKKISKQLSQLSSKYDQLQVTYTDLEQKYNTKEKQCEQLLQEAGKWQKKYEMIKVQIEGFKELDVIAQEYDEKIEEIVFFSIVKPKAMSKVIDDFCKKKQSEMESWRNKYSDELAKVLQSKEAKDLQNFDQFGMPGQSLQSSFDYKNMRFTSKF